jgi:cysteine-rich repeat protein
VRPSLRLLPVYGDAIIAGAGACDDGDLDTGDGCSGLVQRRNRL